MSTKSDESLTAVELAQQIKGLEETEKDISKIMDSIENPQEIPIDDLDVTIDNTLLPITKAANNVNHTDTVSDSNQTTPEDLRAVLIEQMRKMDPEKRVQFMTNLAKMQQINPTNRNYSNLTDNHRENLKKKLREKKEQLAMQRKSKHCILKMKEQYDNTMADINEKIETMIGSGSNSIPQTTQLSSIDDEVEKNHVHSESCNHTHTHIDAPNTPNSSSPSNSDKTNKHKHKK